MKYENIQVECYNGYRACERPMAFTHAGVRHQVAEVLDRWYEGSKDPRNPRLDYFKVRTGEGKEFILRYSSLFGGWGILVE